MAPLLHLSAAILALLSGVTGKKFRLVKTYDKHNFFDEFHFNTTGTVQHDDNGSFVKYYNKSDALNHGLARNTSNDEVYLGVEHNISSPDVGRGGLRLVSRDTIGHGLIIANFTHMPEPQCGGWPAFWTLGAGSFPDDTGAGPWPYSGEIDIYEGWNLLEYNRPTLHTAFEGTSKKCSLNTTAGAQTAHIKSSNCDNNYENVKINQYQNQGCESEDRSSGLRRSESGRIYALVKTSDVIEIYQWHPSEAPANLNNHEIDTEHWGTPSVRVQKSLCDIDFAFKEQRMMFSLTFCGNPVENNHFWKELEGPEGDTCDSIAGGKNCSTYVAENPGAFRDFYFQVKDIRYFDIKDETMSSTPAAALATSPLFLNSSPTSATTVAIAPYWSISSKPAAIPKAEANVLNSAAKSSIRTASPTPSASVATSPRRFNTSASAIDSTHADNATTLAHVISSSHRLNTPVPTITLQPVDSSPGLNKSTPATPLVTSSHLLNMSTSATPLAHVAASSHRFNASTSRWLDLSASATLLSHAATLSHRFNTSTPAAALARIAMSQQLNTSATHTTISGGPSSLRPNSSTLTTDSRAIATTSRAGSFSWFNSSITRTATLKPTSSLRHDTTTTGLRSESSTGPSSLSALGTSGSPDDVRVRMPGAEAENSEVCEAPSPDSASPALGTPGSSTMPIEKPLVTPATTLSAELETVTIYNTTTSTTISTIMSCPSSVESCPSRKVTKTIQIVIPWYTTVCPVTAIETQKPTQTRDRWGKIIMTVVIVKKFKITKCPSNVPNCPRGKVSSILSTKTCPAGDCGPASPTAIHTEPGSVRGQDPTQAPTSESPAHQAPPSKSPTSEALAHQTHPSKSPVNEAPSSRAPVNRGHANKASVDDDLVEEDPVNKAPDASVPALTSKVIQVHTVISCPPSVTNCPSGGVTKTVVAETKNMPTDSGHPQPNDQRAQAPSDASTSKVPAATPKPISPKDTKSPAVETTSHRPKESANSKPDAPLGNPGNRQHKSPDSDATAAPAKIPDRKHPTDDPAKSRDPEHYPGQTEGNLLPDSQGQAPGNINKEIKIPGDDPRGSKPEAPDGGRIEPLRVSRFGSEGSEDVVHDSQPSSDGGRLETSRLDRPDSEVPGDAPHDANIAGDGNGGSKSAGIEDRPAGAAKTADPQRPTPATKPLAPACVGAGCQSGSGPSRGTCAGENCLVQVNSAAKKCASFLVIGAALLAF